MAAKDSPKPFKPAPPRTVFFHRADKIFTAGGIISAVAAEKISKRVPIEPDARQQEPG
jgi:hypothetical protein